MKKVISELRSYCLNRWPKDLGETHGVEHWDRVARFGKMLYQVGVDMNVVTAFAYLHDSERMNNAEDIDTCFDADRMDLFRNRFGFLDDTAIYDKFKSEEEKKNGGKEGDSK